MAEASLAARAARKVRRLLADGCDAWAVRRIRRNPAAWPCAARKHLLVGCEASGTTPVAHLLWNDGSMRFLLEGKNPWVWRAYMDVYRGERAIRDYPRLQIYDAVKVPGFAAILDHYAREFPNAAMVYLLRDPRDVLAATYKRWGVSDRDGLRDVPWCSQSWLGIEDDDPVARLAWRWRLYYEASRRVEGVLYVRYEDFCRDKVGCIAGLAARVGTPFDEARVRSLCDVQASHDSVRPYRPEGPGAWSRGLVAPRDAELIESVCAGAMKEWGYL